MVSYKVDGLQLKSGSGLILLDLENSMPSFENRVDQDQLASNEASWSGSTMFFHPHNKAIFRLVCGLWLVFPDHTHIFEIKGNQILCSYSKTCVKCTVTSKKKRKFVFKTNYRLMQVKSINCRMHQGDHSAILSTFIKLPFAIKIRVLCNFEWLFYTGFTV